MEQRHFKRVRFFSQAQLEADGQVYPTEVLDLSLKGALVKKPVDTLPAAPTTLCLRLQLSGSVEHITMQVSIAHQHDDHLGLYCEKIDLDSISHLRRLLELNLGDPELLNRELAELINIE